MKPTDLEPAGVDALPERPFRIETGLDTLPLRPGHIVDPFDRCERFPARILGARVDRRPLLFQAIGQPREIPEAPTRLRFGPFRPHQSQSAPGGRVGEAVAKLKAEHDLTPGLAVVLVGENPASEVYVRNKNKQTLEAGMNSFEHKLSAETTQDELLALVGRLNADPKVHGILVQLPLPDRIADQAVIDAVDPDKDVDGFHVINAGRLMTTAKGSQPPLVPCTPLGCLMMLKAELGDLSGLRAVVVGRSNIVGKPMAQLLLKDSCTVTIAHSRTKDIEALKDSCDQRFKWLEEQAIRERQEYLVELRALRAELAEVAQ